MGGSGGIASLTDQDIAGAVAMARQYKQADRKGKRPEAPLLTCVRPELLLMHYAGRADFVPLIARRCSDAIAKNRELMGATDPAKAEQGTIRAAHGANIEFNAVHGSDAPETAKFEIGYFFAEMELVG